MIAKRRIFVTGTDTEIGKTVVSSILVNALEADYWKPVQSGDLHQTDTDTVKRLTNNRFTYHPEAYRLNTPASPHASARIDGVEIDMMQIKLPETTNDLVVEGAGGLMVPLNDHDLLIDWVVNTQLSVVLVSGNKLGSINHTLLSIETLMNRNLDILGIIFNGPATPESENFITKYSGLPVITKVPSYEEWNAELSAKHAAEVRNFFEREP